MLRRNTYFPEDQKKNDQRKVQNSYLKQISKRESFSFTKKTSLNDEGGKRLISTFLWIFGGIAAIVSMYVIGSFLKTRGVSAKLIFQEGEVFIKKDAEEEWIKGNDEIELKNSYEVKTNKGGRAIIEFEDGSVLRMNEYSRVILFGDKERLSIVQTDGEVYHRVIKDEKRKYEVELTGIMGVEKRRVEAMGTAFWTNKKGTEITVGTLENKVKFFKENQDDGVELDEGQKIVIKKEEEVKKEITSDDIKATFLIWNIEQDEKKGLSLSAFIKLKKSELDKTSSTSGVAMTHGEDNEGADEEGSAGISGEDLSNASNGKLNLEGEVTSDGVILKWDLEGIEAPNGFKVIRNLTPNPEYPGSYYRSVRLSSAKTYTWNVVDGKTHHFRVCVYDGTAGCKLYSNDLELVAKESPEGMRKTSCEESNGIWEEGEGEEEGVCSCPSGKELKESKCVSKKDETEDEEETNGRDVEKEKISCEESNGTWNSEEKSCSCPTGEKLENKKCVKEEDFATDISVSGSSSEKGVAVLNWSISGGNAPKGFKIVRSKSKNPVYPGDKYRSVSSGNESYSWEDLVRGEIYYFRVCVWDGNKCIVYSNNVKVEIK